MKKTTIKDFLENKIPQNLINKVNRSFEIVGDIAITEIETDLIPYENEIGKAILQVNKAIKVVLKKSGIHKGEFRTQDLIHIAGEKRKETIYKENGIQLIINPETVYFSSKLSTEREKLTENIKPNSRVLVMFSGSGPYTYVALKKQPNLAEITSIEINPEGHKYALESLKLNKNLLKKSNTYKNLTNILKKNKIPIYEKKIIENLNNLKIHFINADVKKISKSKELQLKTTHHIFKDTHNKLFEENLKDLIQFLSESNITQLNLDLDTTNFNTNKLLTILILFLDKFTFNCKINNETYIFDENFHKNILFNYLENQVLTCKFDEIFMPLPKDAELFLEDAFKFANKNCLIHMYDFLHENEFPQKAENAIKSAAKNSNLNIKILQTRKVGQYSPRKFRTCTDFIIE